MQVLEWLQKVRRKNPDQRASFIVIIIIVTNNYSSVQIIHDIKNVMINLENLHLIIDEKMYRVFSIIKLFFGSFE